MRRVLRLQIPTSATNKAPSLADFSDPGYTHSRDIGRGYADHAERAAAGFDINSVTSFTAMSL